MRMMYLLPQTNMTIDAPVGNAIRIREIIRGFEKLGGQVFIDSAGENAGDVAAMNIYRGGLRDKLPPRVAGTLRDAFYIAQDYKARPRIRRRMEDAMPLDLVMEEFTHFRRAGVSLARQLRVPIFIDDIVPFYEAEVYHFRRELKTVALQMQRQVFREASGLIAVAPFRDYLLSEGVPAEKIHMVTNGADTERFRPGIGGDAVRTRYGIGPDRVIVGFVGSFLPWRGLPMLIECARALCASQPNLHFLLVGDGDNRAELEAQVQGYGLGDRVTFTGSVPFDQVPPYVDAMDITVVPDSNEYTSPIKIFEYMALAKPVVAPRYTPIEEIISDGHDGMLFNPKDQDALNQAVLALASDDARREAMSTLSRSKIVENYTWVRHAQTLYDLARQAAPALS